MRSQWKFTYDGPAFENFLIKLLVLLRVAHVDARAQHSNRTAMGVHGSLMPDSVNAARQAAADHQASRSEITAEPLRHLRAIERRAPRADDAEARQVQYLRIAAHIKKNRRVIDLQQVLRI